MSNELVQSNETERVYATALDADGDPVTSLTDVLIEIRRVSDGQYYDFNDNTFKASGWTTRQQQMSELDVTNSAGVYYYDFNTTGLSADKYFIRVSSATAENMPAEGHLTVGGYVDSIDTTISSRAPENEYDTELATLQSDVTDIKAKTDTIDWSDIGTILTSLGDIASDIADILSDTSAIDWADITSIASELALVKAATDTVDWTDV